jgi:GMP synthase-like glutamine amidotransferase
VVHPEGEVIVLQHSESDGPGAIGRELALRGVPLRVVRLQAGETLPSSMVPRAVVAMGGPMAADDDAEFPFLEDARGLLGATARAGLPVLGVCLGAQLLAIALGGRVERGGARELGWYDVERTPASTGDPLFDALPQRFAPFQWHDDAIELPPEALLLARSAIAPVQAFRVGERAYGVQFHLELSATEIAEWSREAPRPIHGSTLARAAEQERLARRFFGGWADRFVV